MFIPVSLRRSRLRYALLPLALLLVSCGGDEGVVVSGDVPGLDTMGLRGDSLIARASRPFPVDSLRLSLEFDSAASTTPGSPARAPGEGRPPVVLPAVPGENPMSRRAVARGDSMARAAAQRLVGAASGGARARPDSVRGIVTLTGNPPARQTVLRNSAGNLVSLSGMATTGLSRLEGLEIVVHGMKVTPRDVVVSDFVVRAAKGVPAFDGILEESGGAWSLKLSDGSGIKRIGSIPTPLRGLSGARVWISMRNGGPPEGYGLILRR